MSSINEIIKENKELPFRMQLHTQRDDKAALQLTRGKVSYQVNYIYEPRVVFKSFAEQHRNLLQGGPLGSIFLNFFANKQKEWILHIARDGDLIEISLDIVSTQWKKLSNRFNWTCSINEYIRALYAFVETLPDDKKTERRY